MRRSAGHTRRPAGLQRWRDLLFIHWDIDPDVLRPLVPDELGIDVYDGRAFVTVIPLALSRFTTTGRTSVLDWYGSAPSRAPSRAAVVRRFDTIIARPNSTIPIVVARRTGRTTAISTAAAPRRACRGRGEWGRVSSGTALLLGAQT